MKRLILGVAIASALGLTGCGEDSFNEAREEATPLIPASHMVFDPAEGEVPLPNDLLFSGTTDGTLNIPSKAGDPSEANGDYTDPKIALGALDGWSTTSPISIDVELANDSEGNPLTLNAASVAQAGAVRVFEATVGGALSSDPECKAKPSVSACKVGEELQFGVDFISTASGNKVVIVPLKPLKAGQSYIYATTKLIEDSASRPIEASSSYGLLKMDIETLPLETPDQLMLQTLVNSYEKSLAATHGVDPDSISYSALFTTQSVAEVYETSKLLMAQPGSPYAPKFVQEPTPAGYTVAQAAGLTPADGKAYVLADLADVYTATIEMPIYGTCSSVSCLDGEGHPLINGRWKAQGDSPVSVLLALQAGTLSQEKFISQAQAQSVDPTTALANPSLLAGKTWLLDDGTPADKAKHLTKFNPIPAIQTHETVPVLISMPNAAKLVEFYKDKGGFVPPTSGWPTNIAMHGLGGGKEMSLAYAGAYAAAGIATVAIDMPLHGERSFDADKDGVYEVTASYPEFGASIGKPAAFANGNILSFINIGSSLSVRDNFRQGILDHLELRLALTGMAQSLAAEGKPQVFDVTKISAQGLSLGAIVGTSFSTYASTGLVNPMTGDALPNAYALNAASLVAPSGGLAGAFVGSAGFGPLLFSNISTSPTFLEQVNEANTQGYEPGSQQYSDLVKTVYAEFVPTFAFAVQTAVDSIDPVNQGARLAATELPLHLIEVVGDGAANLPDQTLPNRVEGFPLSGTEPLISALGLGCVDSTSVGSGAVRFAKGHHSSIVSPSEVPGVTDGFAAAATAEMQSQVVGFAASAGLGQATIVVAKVDENETSVISPCAN
ncbi:lipase [Shewanella sp. AS16]|uniref:VolA/Pla-1 family phospholipase n=1 Tax=Shewanella sp. AS16 TaxID=2907625 RepID=UPI001F3955FE|nr:VolA/Pla-1 family phospholipase [Shewanella sp. AS16]MCE9686879.1 lipase [Shewanella sp. AS16]